jgi:hypothetical protein
LNIEFIEIYLLIFKKIDVPEIIEQLIWHLGNLVGDNTHARDIIISSKLYDEVINIITQHKRMASGVVKMAVWFVSNCVKNKPEPIEEVVIFY